MSETLVPLTSKPRVAAIPGFATLAALEAGVRGTLISVLPLVVYDAIKDEVAYSRLYFIVGIASMVVGLLVPALIQRLQRRFVYSLGCLFYLAAMAAALVGGAFMMAVALFASSAATAMLFVCYNAYVLDYVDRDSLGRQESTRMFVSALPWAVGPVLGVKLHHWWEPAPFLLAGAFAIALFGVFWWLRLGNGKDIIRRAGRNVFPLAFLGRFFQQPRLIAGWLFAVVRSGGWWVHVVYLPVFCIEAGLGEATASWVLSASNSLLVFTPLMRRLAERLTLRTTVRASFACGALAMILAAVLSPLGWPTPLLVFIASIFFVMLDTCGGLPFLLAVKPSERTEMAAIYSSFRDVSGIATPGVAWAVLLVAPVAGVMAASGVAMAAAFVVAGSMHPRLGVRR
jgi:MFS transporter, ACDE family, multidrug resistance protein